MEEKIRVCIISDLHGLLPEIEECELLLICGDIVPLDIQRDVKKSLEWFSNVFLKWCEDIPCAGVFCDIIFIGGNHDLFLERTPKEIINQMCPFNVHYIENESFQYLGYNGKTYNIFGTPYCHIFGNWSFMVSDEKLEKLFSKIPRDTDIIMSHDAPLGISDILLQNLFYTSKGHIGSAPLRNAIERVIPQYVFHGHLHSTNHDCELLNITKIYNTSLLDECYEYKYKPLYLEI